MSHGSSQEPLCSFCSVSIASQKGGVFRFCSVSCQHAKAREEFEGRWVLGEVSGMNSTGQASGFIRSILLEAQSRKCAICRLDEWMGEAIPLELDHVNGDSFDCSRENVRLICCNCHSTTPTYKGRNRGSGRLSRARRIIEGDSGGV